MRARLAFGACLAIDFDVYLIDEVTEIGDERFRRKCAAAFRERLRSSDIILATHNHHTIRQYCDRGAVLAGGRLQLFDSVAGAFEYYRAMLDRAGLMSPPRAAATAAPVPPLPPAGNLVTGLRQRCRRGPTRHRLRARSSRGRRCGPGTGRRVPLPGFAPGCRRACSPLSRSSSFRHCSRPPIFSPSASDQYVAEFRFTLNSADAPRLDPTVAAEPALPRQPAGRARIANSRPVHRQPRHRRQDRRGARFAPAVFSAACRLVGAAADAGHDRRAGAVLEGPGRPGLRRRPTAPSRCGSAPSIPPMRCGWPKRRRGLRGSGQRAVAALAA